MAEEYESQLVEYNENLREINEELKKDSKNEDLINARKELLDIIEITEDLLRKEKMTKTVIINSHQNGNGNNNNNNNNNNFNNNNNNNESTNDDEFGIGGKCYAKYTDGNWYEAEIILLPNTNNNKFRITYLGYGNTEDVDIEDISPHSAPVPTLQLQSTSTPTTTTTITTAVSTDTTGKNGKKRTAADFNNERDKETGEFQIPKYLKILPTDDEETRNSKRKRIKAIKNANRKKELEEERVEKKNQWQTFASASKVTKKSSMFSSPDSIEGRVGVINSGKKINSSERI